MSAELLARSTEHYILLGLGYIEMNKEKNE
jgi:hypothetical protein